MSIISTKKPTESFIGGVKRNTRRTFSDEAKNRIVVEGFSGEKSIAEICRREVTAQSMFYKWNKDFIEAERRRLARDTKGETNSDEVAKSVRKMKISKLLFLSSVSRTGC